jgi:hypothetical protein
MKNAVGLALDGADEASLRTAAARILAQSAPDPNQRNDAAASS